MKRPALLLTISALITLAVILSSCATKHTGKPFEPTKFLTSTGVDTKARISRLPFEHSWRDPRADISKYKNIVIRPVTVKYLHMENWEQSKSAEIPNKRAYERRARRLAEYFTKQLNISFSDPICLYYKVDDKSKPNTLVLEVALTEAHFQDPSVKPLGMPFCAFEAKVRDGQTGKILITSADRRGPDLRLGGENAHVTGTQEICAIWARQLLEASNKEIFAKVRRKLIRFE